MDMLTTNPTLEKLEVLSELKNLNYTTDGIRRAKELLMEIRISGIANLAPNFTANNAPGGNEETGEIRNFMTSTYNQIQATFDDLERQLSFDRITKYDYSAIAGRLRSLAQHLEINESTLHKLNSAFKYTIEQFVDCIQHFSAELTKKIPPQEAEEIPFVDQNVIFEVRNSIGNERTTLEDVREAA